MLAGPIPERGANEGNPLVLESHLVHSPSESMGATWLRLLRAPEEALDALATPVPTPAEVPILPQTERVEFQPRNETPISGRTQAGPVGVQILRATYYGTPSDGYGYNCPAQCVTASGDWFDPAGLTAASRLFQLGDRLEICYDGQCIYVRLNDRCRCMGLDLSRGAFERLAPLSRGVIQVEVRVIQ